MQIRFAPVRLLILIGTLVWSPISAMISRCRGSQLLRVSLWPRAAPLHPLCKPAEWQSSPMRVTLQPTGGEPKWLAMPRSSKCRRIGKSLG